MKFDMNSRIFDGAFNVIDFFGGNLPFEYSGPRSEFMACRENAWLGINLNFSPSYDVYGHDLIKLMNRVFVNRDFSILSEGGSRHGIICNEQGKMLADGVVIKLADNHFHTYFLAPVLQYFVESSGLDVRGEYIEDEI